MLKTLKQTYESIKFTFMHLVKGHKGYIIIVLLSSLFEMLLPFVNMFAIKFIIEEITTFKRMDRAIIYALIMLVCNLLLREAAIFLDWRKSLSYIHVTDEFSNENSNKFMQVDYYCMENPEDLNRTQGMYKAESVAGVVLEQVCALFTSFLGAIGTLAIVATLHPAFLILLTIFIFVIAAVNGRALATSNKLELQASQVKRFGNYLIGIALDSKMGKEIRLFLCEKFFMNKIKKNDEEQLTFSKKKIDTLLKANLISIVLNSLETFCLYAYMSLEFVKGALSISQFTLYLSSAKNFSDCILKMIQSFTAIAAQYEFIQKHHSFWEMPQTLRDEGNEAITRNGSGGVELEFRDVSFQYPSSENYVLENINFKMSVGETLSIVGENGAGKTTLIKLICRLYKPTTGSILLNGKLLEQYDYDSYMKCVATVFQDFKLFAFTVRDNLDCTGTKTNDELNMAMNQSGIFTKISKLPQGIDSHLYKGKGWDGIELSGGEYQKLAIARAYLKDAEIIIMDEPTAALDPIAEYNIYRSVGELMKDKNAVFISHRMSSSIFSDRILFLADKTIAEMGTHEELLQRKGRYADMFIMQAKNYK